MSNLTKNIEELMENKRQNELFFQKKENEIEGNNKEIRTLQAKNNKLNKTAITEKNKYENKVEEYNHLKDRFSKVKNIANSSVHKRLRRDEHYIKKQASHQLDELDREEEVSYKEYTSSLMVTVLMNSILRFLPAEGSLSPSKKGFIGGLQPVP